MWVTSDVRRSGADGGAAGAADERDVVVRSSFRGVVVAERLLCHGVGGRRQRFCVGAGRGVAAPVAVELIDGASHALVEEMADGFFVHVAAAMGGVVQVDNQTFALEDWIARHGSSFLVPVAGEVHLVCGEMSFRIGRTERPPAVRGRLFALRWSEQRYTVGVAVGLLLVLFALSFLPPEAGALASYRLGRDVRLLAFRLVPLEEQARQRQRSLQPPGGGGPAGGARQAPPRAPDRRRAIRARPAPVDPRSNPRLRAEQIRESGILGLLRPDGDAPWGTLFSRASALGEDPQDLLGDLVASRADESYGIGGLVVRGTGAPGAQEGTLGLGRLHTIGMGPGGRPGIDHAGGPGRLGRRVPHQPEVVAERAIVRGGLDREIIRRIVRQHINEIRYCYERELPRAPSLQGRVAVRFTVAPTGQVAAAALESTSLQDVRVELCVLAAVRRWAFPKPQGGGLVVATYPFNFVRAGSP